MSNARLPVLVATGDAPLIQAGERFISAQHFLSEAIAISQRLPRARYVLNLCEERHEFMLSFAAAMLAGQISLLPPSRAEGSLRSLMLRYPDSYALTGEGCDFRAPDAVSLASLRGALRGSMGAITTIPTIPTIPLVRATELSRAVIEADQSACIAFTSGSTGAPTEVHKSWGELWITAEEIATRFGIAVGPNANDVDTIVGTVPPQHMYGLETTVMLPLASGAVVNAGRPLLPADVTRGLQLARGRAWLVSTPMSLRAFASDPLFHPRLAGVISATMPLEERLAREIEARWAAPLFEIYGCTEGGSLASRQLTREAIWQTLGEITVQARDETVYVSGGHLPAPVALADVITVESADRFTLHGRAANLVKVGGKRTSIEALNAALLAVTGVEDGTFFVPTGSDRPAACVVAPGRSTRQILDALRDQIDAVFLPRPLHFLDRLPRNELGKVPHAVLNALSTGAER